MLPDLSVQIPLGGFVNRGEQVAIFGCETLLGTNQLTIRLRQPPSREGYGVAGE
jgi:hypothetical protein